MKIELTKEQLTIIDHVTKNDGLLLISAKAGCSKSSTARMVVDTLKPKTGLYSAFNKMIVKEGEDRFAGTNVIAKTFHSLAFQHRPKGSKIEPFTYLCIEEELDYPIKLKAIKLMEEFFNSASTDVEEFMEHEDTTSKKLAIKYINKMVNNEIPVTFGFILKYLHLLLHQKIIELRYDLVIFDEFQDTSKVSLEIFKLIDSPKKIGLGDQFQTIYGFMNLADGFKELKGANKLTLTKSFRVSDDIAKRIEKYGKNHLDDNFIFTGTDKPLEDGLTAYITATNAQIVRRISILQSENKGFTLTKPIKEIFAAPLALLTASGGKKVFHKKYKFLEQEFDNFKYSNFKTFFKYLINEVNDKEIHTAIGLLSSFRSEGINIYDVLKKTEKRKKDKSILISTAHSCKGLEFSTVYIEDDLNAVVNEAMEGKTKDGDFNTPLKLGYVAASRSRSRLINCKFL